MIDAQNKEDIYEALDGFVWERCNNCIGSGGTGMIVGGISWGWEQPNAGEVQCGRCKGMGFFIRPKVSMIVAYTTNRVIGQNGSLPWDIPEDMKWFRNKTRNKTVIMGRKTYESIGRPLPKRKNIVITSKTKAFPDSIFVANSLEQAVEIAKNSGQEIMIIGGGEVYRQALPIVDRIYATEIHTKVNGDTYFPDIGKDWNLSFVEEHDGSPAFTFNIYERDRS